MGTNAILVTRSLPSAVIAKLRDVGTVEVFTNGGMSPDLLRQRVTDKDAVVTALTDDINKSVIDVGTKLRIVANVAVVYNNIDVAYARTRAIVVTNTSEVTI